MNLIDRDKLIEKLKQYANDMCVSLWNDIICLINEQPIVNEWIPVERELPKHEKQVLITDADGEVYLAKRNAYREIWDCGYFAYVYEDVVAWKPIEPYIGDKE